MTNVENDEPLDISLLDGPPHVISCASLAEDAPPRPIEYATPAREASSKAKLENRRFMEKVARKSLFVIGLGIFASGLGEAVGARAGDDAPAAMAFGAMMVGLAIPLSRRAGK